MKDTATKHHYRTTSLSFKDHCVHCHLPFYMTLVYTAIKCDFDVFGDEWHNKCHQNMYICICYTYAVSSTDTILSITVPHMPQWKLTRLRKQHPPAELQANQCNSSISNGPFNISACSCWRPVLHLCMAWEIKQEQLLLYSSLISQPESQAGGKFSFFNLIPAFCRKFYPPPPPGILILVW